MNERTVFFVRGCETPIFRIGSLCSIPGEIPLSN